MKFSYLIVVVCTISEAKLAISEKPDTSDLLEDVAAVFVADDLRKGLIPAVKECWDALQDLSKSGKAADGFWNGTFYNKLKSFHEKILEFDNAVLAHAPSNVLNKIVNLTTLDSLEQATDEVDAKKDLEWIKKVKVGWVKIQSLTLQVYWKYEWIFDYLFKSEFENDIDEEMEMIVAEKERLYYAWNAVPGRGDGPEKYRLDIGELTTFAKEVMSGVEDPKAKHDLFYGLKALLDLEETEPGSTGPATPSNMSCTGNQTFAGYRERGHDLIPVYVLLHLLNAEFKFYIIRNVANMYLCAHFKKCNFQTSDELQKHLDEYYEFYFSGMVKAFISNAKPKEDSGNETDPNAWRWRCDPVKNHVEDLTYVRFYDFETGFVANEQDLSSTQSCRDTCDTYDSGYSQIPCPERNWTCLGQDGDFDCLDKTRHAIPCPDPKSTRICPNGIMCTTTSIKSAKVCMGSPKSKRYIDWIDTDAYKQVLGRKTTCPKMSLIELSVNETLERSEITKYEPQRCEVCLCHCMEPLGNNSHRYLGLIPQLANVQEGFVLVGAKFTKVTNVIHIKIAEGKLVDGIIDQSTVHWVQPQPISNISDSTQVYRLGSESRRLLLDDFTIPDGVAITGLRFNSVDIPVPHDYVKVSHEPRYSMSQDASLKWTFGFVHKEVRLEAQVTGFNDKGELDPSTSRWLFNENTSVNRKPVHLNGTDIPIYAPNTSQPIGPPNSFVKVQSSSLKKDAAQTPVPFFDAQELIEPSNITTLTNIGLFLKGQKGYGGFVTFRFRSKPVEEPPPSSNYNLWQLMRKGLYADYAKTLL